MKFIYFFKFLLLIYIQFISSQDIPYFSSFPNGPISNYTQSSIQVVLKASSPLFIVVDDKIKSISDSDAQVSQWFELNNPIILSTDIGDLIFPKLVSFTNYDLTLSISTPVNCTEFILFILENTFYNKDSVSVPYSSPLIISRSIIKYTYPDIIRNPLHLYKYSQQFVNDWDQNLNIKINDLTVRYSSDETPFLDVTISIPNSGKGEVKLDSIIKIDGNEYLIEDSNILISKKNQIFKVPIELVDSLDLVQEDTSKRVITNPPFEKSTRLDFYADVLKIQSGELVCIEEPTLFQHLTLSGISQMENNDSLKFQFRYSASPSIIFVEYTWSILNGWSKALYLNKGHQCNKLDIRNQFCPYCPEVFHRMTKTNYTYLVYKSASVSSLLDFGLEFSANMFNSSFYFKNKNENVLQNSQNSLSFSYNDSFNLDYNYVLIPGYDNKDSSFYLWLPSIINGCNGINISYSDFYYGSSCQMPQYSCSNIHYFREPQNETVFMNSKYNFNYDNKRSGIMYNMDSLTFEIPQTRMNFNFSLFIPSLPFLQPFIRENSFKSSIDEYYINVKYSFLNYGRKEGYFSINLSCNGSSITQANSGIIKPNETLEYSLSFPKSIIFKKVETYECIAKVSINALKYWSKSDKELVSTTQFSFSGGGKECNQNFSKNPIIISKEYKGKSIQDQLAFLFKIENHIEDIDWFMFNISCSKETQSQLIQVPSGGFLNIPIFLNNHSPNSICKISIDSFQADCNFNIISDNWRFMSDLSNSSNKVTVLSKSTILSLLFFIFLTFI